jgi:hypothetical protein
VSGTAYGLRLTVQGRSRRLLRKARQDGPRERRDRGRRGRVSPFDQDEEATVSNCQTGRDILTTQ